MRERLLDRLSFWRKSLQTGWSQLVHIRDHFDLALYIAFGLLTLLGLGIVLTIRDQAAWIAPVTIVGVLLLMLMEGAYVQWRVGRTASGDLVDRAKTLEQKLDEFTAKKLRIVHGDDPPFVQRDDIYIIDREGQRAFLRNQLVFRVGVENLSNTTLRGVVLEIERMDPPVLAVPLPLHKMHDNPPPGAPYQREFRIDSRDIAYVDVCFQQDNRGVVQIYRAVPGIPTGLSAGEYRVTLHAHGDDDLQPARRSGVIRLHSDNWLEFYLDSEGEA